MPLLLMISEQLTIFVLSKNINKTYLTFKERFKKILCISILSQFTVLVYWSLTRWASFILVLIILWRIIQLTHLLGTLLAFITSLLKSTKSQGNISRKPQILIETSLTVGLALLIPLLFKMNLIKLWLFTELVRDYSQGKIFIHYFSFKNLSLTK